MKTVFQYYKDDTGIFIFIMVLIILFEKCFLMFLIKNYFCLILYLFCSKILKALSVLIVNYQGKSVNIFIFKFIYGAGNIFSRLF